jgi:hypothetical protein
MGLGEMVITGWSFLLTIGLVPCGSPDGPRLQEMTMRVERYASDGQCDARKAQQTALTDPLLAALPKTAGLCQVVQWTCLPQFADDPATQEGG